MNQFHLLLILLLLHWAVSQNNICYSNCRKGSCLATNALSCNACDPGLLNINTRCITTNVQPTPLTYLKPNAANTLLDGASATSCDVTTGIATTKMMYLPIIGISHTQQFQIPSSYSYLRLKFNAIVLSGANLPQAPTLLVSVVSSTDLRNALSSQIQSAEPSVLAINCNSNIPNRNNFYGTYFMDYKIQTSARSIIVQTIPQGVINTYLGVSYFQVLYGNCHETCATCIGPTNRQCTSCKGLLTTLTNGVCTICPSDFYLNVTCFPCPVECQACSFTNGVVRCTSCKNLNGISYNLVQGGCQTTQNQYKTLTGSASSFNFSTWTSSAVLVNPTSSCGAYDLLGGLSIGRANSFFSYTINNLPVHTLLHVVFNALLIDQNPNDQYEYSVEVDGVPQLIRFNIPAQGTNQCGSKQIQYLKPETVQFSHLNNSATVVIRVLKSFMGIRDFMVVVDNPTTDPNCINYLNNNCQTCRNGLIVQNGVCSGCLSGFYMDASFLQCLPCPQTCTQCFWNGNTTQVDCTACRKVSILQGRYCIDNNLYSSEIVPNIPLSSQKLPWTFYPNLQNNGRDSCGANEILGSSTIKYKFLSMNRTFTDLPPHTGVVLYFTFWQIDDNYFPNDSLAFVLNGVRYTVNNITNISALSNLKMDLCGNSSLDSRFVVQLQDAGHTVNSSEFLVYLNRMGKIGISNLQLFLMNSASTTPTFELELMPEYSVSTPPLQGLQVKVKFSRPYFSTTGINNAFSFEYVSKNNNQGRLLVEGFSNSKVIQNHTRNNQEILYFINPNRSLDDNYELAVRASSPDSVIFEGASGQYQQIGQNEARISITRYTNISTTADVADRSALRNFFNMFRGCAILALFIGMASFIFGMSAAFDDFFILCQLIFVHVFIQMDYYPASIRVPFTGLHIVQFLEWLPSAARISIQDGIIPKNLYQPNHLAFQQYYQDVTLARTIYHSILFVALMFAIWLIIHVILLIYESKHPNEDTEHKNFFVYYYQQYSSKTFVFVDKVARFVYFTVCWACMLQWRFFYKEPQGYHGWTTALLVVLSLGVLVYPLVMFLLLRWIRDSTSVATYDSTYEELRINRDILGYYMFRYYKLLLIAFFVPFLFTLPGYVTPIILAGLHLIDFIIILAGKPFEMKQDPLLGSICFYPHNQTMYHVTALIQQVLFFILQIFFIILNATKDQSSSMGVGYAICAFVIMLLLNGLFRLVWGLIKLLQYCYHKREETYLAINKDQNENEGIDRNTMLPVDNKTQRNLTRNNLAELTSKILNNNSRKKSYVSKIR